MKKQSEEIANYKLDQSFYTVHKEWMKAGDFGMDQTNQLVEGGFGLYSSEGVKQKIGPIKSEFFRIGFCARGSVQIHCGLENFRLTPGSIAFTFPGQVFSLQDKSKNLLAYYMLFSENFIADALPLKKIREDYPFLNYSGTQSFLLKKKEAKEIQNYILRINDEIKQPGNDLKQIIQLYLHLILLQSNRSYEIQNSADPRAEKSDHRLLSEYKKLVSRDFAVKRKVSEYADMMHITSNHLNRVVKIQTGKTAHELIEEMLLLEAKALLMHTGKSVAEISWQLNFTDPSHFNKFFKKLSGLTPLQYRKP